MTVQCAGQIIMSQCAVAMSALSNTAKVHNAVVQRRATRAVVNGWKDDLTRAQGLCDEPGLGSKLLSLITLGAYGTREARFRKAYYGVSGVVTRANNAGFSIPVNRDFTLSSVLQNLAATSISNSAARFAQTASEAQRTQFATVSDGPSRLNQNQSGTNWSLERLPRAGRFRLTIDGPVSMTIGRLPSMDAQVDYQGTVSRRHVRLKVDPDYTMQGGEAVTKVDMTWLGDANRPLWGTNIEHLREFRDDSEMIFPDDSHRAYLQVGGVLIEVHLPEAAAPRTRGMALARREREPAPGRGMVVRREPTRQPRVDERGRRGVMPAPVTPLGRAIAKHAVAQAMTVAALIQRARGEDPLGRLQTELNTVVNLERRGDERLSVSVREDAAARGDYFTIAVQPASASRHGRLTVRLPYVVEREHITGLMGLLRNYTNVWVPDTTPTTDVELLWYRQDHFEEDGIGGLAIFPTAERHVQRSGFLRLISAVGAGQREKSTSTHITMGLWHQGVDPGWLNGDYTNEYGVPTIRAIIPLYPLEEDGTPLSPQAQMLPILNRLGQAFKGSNAELELARAMAKLFRLEGAF